MKEKMTNLGKKEQRQSDRLLEKEFKEAPAGPRSGKEAEARTVPKQHSMKGTKTK